MPHLEKGSEEAKQQRLRMEQLRESKMGGSAIGSFAKAINTISPARLFENQHVRNAGATAGKITNENLLPAVVDMGKLVQETTATRMLKEKKFKK